MADFRNQIEEDIKEYKEKHGETIPAIYKSEWAFNFWILDKFFNEDEELIADKITDYSDCGIDEYEWYETTKELYLIQNKYYSDDTPLRLNYVQNTFLVTPLAVLNNGTYTKSKELQNIYTKYKNDDDFTVHLQIYITNDKRDEKILEAIKSFNRNNGPKIFAEIFYLSDIELKYYDEEPKKKTKFFSTFVESVNKETVLNINNDEYHLDHKIDAKYVFAPVTCLYKMVKDALEINYDLFEKNIREYLGNKGINKRIYNTLKDSQERKNFFYYNNGVTIICSKMGELQSDIKSNNSHINVSFTIENPQIVNGCQTVNTIYSVLNSECGVDVEKEYQDAFVMLKILQIDSADKKQKDLSMYIVTYNNSQNSLDEKQFVANEQVFQRIKREFKKKGFLLITKQSDKNTYANAYKKKSDLSKLQMISISKRQLFGLDSLKKVTDFEIPIEKLLQVILAFKEGGLTAYTMKKDVLKKNSDTYNSVVDFIKTSNTTEEVLLDLYLLYIRLEKEKNSQDVKYPTPIPFYAIDGFSRYECKKDVKQIELHFSTQQEINKLITVYTVACTGYTDQYTQQHNVDYIKMIKSAIDYDLFKSNHNSALLMYKSIK